MTFTSRVKTLENIDFHKLIIDMLSTDKRLQQREDEIRSILKQTLPNFNHLIFSMTSQGMAKKFQSIGERIAMPENETVKKLQTLDEQIITFFNHESLADTIELPYANYSKDIPVWSFLAGMNLMKKDGQLSSELIKQMHNALMIPLEREKIPNSSQTESEKRRSARENYIYLKTLQYIISMPFNIGIPNKDGRAYDRRIKSEIGTFIQNSALSFETNAKALDETIKEELKQKKHALFFDRKIYCVNQAISHVIIPELGDHSYPDIETIKNKAFSGSKHCNLFAVYEEFQKLYEGFPKGEKLVYITWNNLERMDHLELSGQKSQEYVDYRIHLLRLNKPYLPIELACYALISGRNFEEAFMQLRLKPLPIVFGYKGTITPINDIDPDGFLSEASKQLEMNKINPKNDENRGRIIYFSNGIEHLFE